MDPAIGLLEFDSIAIGIRAGDAMVKRGPVAELVAGTVHPGKYLVLVGGDVAAVEEALAAGREASGGSIVGEVFLRDVHPDVLAAVHGQRVPGAGEAIGVIETTTVAATLEAADAAVKGADVFLMELNMADGLGGKAYALFCGSVFDVEAAISIGSARIPMGALVGTVVIPQVHAEMGNNLLSGRRFGDRLGRDDAAG
jgi:microcompartment protein CcmL/EutN